jgi:heat shock protein HtpX
MTGNTSHTRHHLTGFLQTGALFALLLLISYRAAGLVFGQGGAIIALITIGLATAWSLGNRQIRLPAGSRRLGYFEAPEVLVLVQELSRRAGLAETPPVYLVPGNAANAATIGTGRDAAIIMTTGLAERLNLRELTGVLAHEVAHAKNGDLVLFAFADAFRSLGRLASVVVGTIIFFAFPMLLFGGAGVAPGSLLFLLAAPFIALLVQLALMRIREYQADLTAAELTGDPNALADALRRIDRPARRISDWFLPAPRRQESPMAGLLRSHPDTEDRVRRLRALGR